MQISIDNTDLHQEAVWIYFSPVAHFVRNLSASSIYLSEYFTHFHTQCNIYDDVATQVVRNIDQIQQIWNKRFRSVYEYIITNHE